MALVTREEQERVAEFVKDVQSILTDYYNDVCQNRQMRDATDDKQRQREMDAHCAKMLFDVEYYLREVAERARQVHVDMEVLPIFAPNIRINKASSDPNGFNIYKPLRKHDFFNLSAKVDHETEDRFGNTSNVQRFVPPQGSRGSNDGTVGDDLDTQSDISSQEWSSAIMKFCYIEVLLI